jgi:hypothetical protein
MDRFYGNLVDVIKSDTQVAPLTKKPITAEDRILVMPSGSGDNDLPRFIAKRLEKAGLGKAIQISSFAERTNASGNTVESKKQKGYVAKMQMPAFETSQDQDPARWAERFKGKHIILVDDVVTTGEGIEAVRLYLRSLDTSLDISGVAALAVHNPRTVSQMKNVEALANTLVKELRGRTDLGDFAKYVENPALLKRLIAETHGRSRLALIERAENQAANRGNEPAFARDPDAAKKVLETLVNRHKLLQEK